MVYNDAMETKAEYKAEFINPRMKRSTIYLPIDLYEPILAAAEKDMISYTAQVRLILRSWLRNQAKGEGGK